MLTQAEPSGPCPIYRPPKGMNGLIELDDATMAQGQSLDVCVVCDGTRARQRSRSVG